MGVTDYFQKHGISLPPKPCSAQNLNLQVIQRSDGYWITNLPEGYYSCGPYRTKREAHEGRAGLRRYFKEEGGDEV